MSRLNLDKNKVLKNINILLVNPQIPENIGLVARVLKNTGIFNLKLINPHLTSKSFEVAKRASDLLKKAKIFNTFKEAIADLSYVFATTRRQREYKTIYNFNFILPQLISLATKKKIGIAFGQEDFGLSKEDLELCECIFYIPANPQFSSYNLAMSVGIVCFEIFNFLENLYSFSFLNLASRRDTEAFFKFLEEKLNKLNFSQEKAKSLKLSLERLFRRTLLTKKEVEILKMIFVKI